MSLRQDAARFGRNQAGTGLAASAAALQGGQAAGGLGGQSLAAAAAPGQQAAGLMGAGGAQMGSAGNTLLSQWGTRSNISANQSAADSAGLGSLIGAIGGAAIMAMSSEESKEDITPTDDERTLGELEQVAVKDWKYREGIADGGRHTGPIAEDMQQVMGDEVAPGGVGLDLVSVSGKHHSAIRGLAKRGRKLEKRIDPLEKRVRRVTGLADVVDAEFRESNVDPAVLQGDISEGIVGLASVH